MGDLTPLEPPQPKAIPIWLWAALTVLPILVSIATTLLTSQLDWFKASNDHNLESRKLDFQLLEFGVGILSAAPEVSSTDPEAANTAKCTNYSAKKWAMGVLGKYSGVPYELPENTNPCAATITFAGPTLAEIARPTEPETLAKGGWVALGYVARGDGSSTSFDEANFTRPDGSDIAPNQLSRGVVVKARLAMNMRPAAAGWGRVLMVIPEDRCVRLSETKILPAGSTFQVWAAAEIADC